MSSEAKKFQPRYYYTDMNKSALYRKNVCAIIIDPDSPRMIYAFRRHRHENGWQFPQGGIDPGESPLNALFRELAEEIGTNEVEVLAALPHPVRYHFPKQVRMELAKKHCSRFIGQEQRYFLCRFRPGAVEKINLPPGEEFDQFRLMPGRELLNFTIPFKRRAYARALRYFDLL